MGSYKVTIWDGEIEVTWNIIAADSRENAIRRARVAHFEKYRRGAEEIHTHKM